MYRESNPAEAAVFPSSVEEQAVGVGFGEIVSGISPDTITDRRPANRDDRLASTSLKVAPMRRRATNAPLLVRPALS
jgi:hypothetical protein